MTDHTNDILDAIKSEQLRRTATRAPALAAIIERVRTMSDDELTSLRGIG